MKRLHIVGKSKDSKRLFLAKTRGAKFGSFEIPISQKLLKLIHEAEAAWNSGRRKQGAAPSAEPVAPDRPAEGAPAAERESRAPAGASEAGIDLPVGTRGERQQAAGAALAPAADAGRGSPARGGEDARRGSERTSGPEEEDAGAAPERRPAAGGLPSQRHRDELRGRVQARRKRPPIPTRSALTPAEIQTLVRSGRTIRTVAQLAGTSTAWVRWLAEPVQQERMGIVHQALQQRQRRARLGAAVAPLGEAVVRNLRSRGMAAPERIVEEGFSALRDGRGWRVRLSYEHRGRRLNAMWSFDPQTRDVVPLNNLAAQLGWLESPREGRPDDDRNSRPAGRPRKSPSAKTRKSTRQRKSSSKTGRSARRTGRRVSTSGRASAPKRTAAAGPSRKPASRTTRASVRSSASKRRRRS